MTDILVQYLVFDQIGHVAAAIVIAAILGVARYGGRLRPAKENSDA